MHRGQTAYVPPVTHCIQPQTISTTAHIYQRTDAWGAACRARSLVVWTSGSRSGADRTGLGWHGLGRRTVLIHSGVGLIR